MDYYYSYERKKEKSEGKNHPREGETSPREDVHLREQKIKASLMATFTGSRRRQSPRSGVLR